MKTILCYDLNENTTFTLDLHARDQDHVPFNNGMCVASHACLISEVHSPSAILFFMDKTFTCASIFQLSAFSFHTFLCYFFQCAVRYPSNSLTPSYSTYTSPRILWSFHTPYRVCLVPAFPYPPLDLKCWSR